jgi:hypothetical protein
MKVFAALDARALAALLEGTYPTPGAALCVDCGAPLRKWVRPSFLAIVRTQQLKTRRPGPSAHPRGAHAIGHATIARSATLSCSTRPRQCVAPLRKTPSVRRARYVPELAFAGGAAALLEAPERTFDRLLPCRCSRSRRCRAQRSCARLANRSAPVPRPAPACPGLFPRMSILEHVNMSTGTYLVSLAAFYSATANLVSWLGSLPHASQWVAG